MAARNVFHVTHLQPFKDWCQDNQIEYRPGRDPHGRQVLQVKIGTAWQCIYHNNGDKEHYSVVEPLMPVIRRFLKDYHS